MNEFVARIRAAALKTPADVHASGTGSISARSATTTRRIRGRTKIDGGRADDPVAMWAYLHALGARNTPLGERYFGRRRGRPEENVTSLEKSEVDRVISCYRELRARRPELAQAEIIQNVSNELKSAKRLEEENRFYQEVLDGAAQIGQIAGALRWRQIGETPMR